MKTIINEHGCTTHPYGEPNLEVTVPLVVNGTNVTDKLTQLTVANLNLSMKVEELEQVVVSLQALAKVLQESQTVKSDIVTPTTEESVVKNGKKSTTKPTSTPTETVSTTSV